MRTKSKVLGSLERSTETLSCTEKTKRGQTGRNCSKVNSKTRTGGKIIFCGKKVARLSNH